MIFPIQTRMDKPKAIKHTNHRLFQYLFYQCATGANHSVAALPKLQKEYLMYTHLDRGGISDWNTLLPQNSLSFSEIQQLISKMEECVFHE